MMLHNLIPICFCCIIHASHTTAVLLCLSCLRFHYIKTITMQDKPVLSYLHPVCVRAAVEMKCDSAICVFFKKLAVLSHLPDKSIDFKPECIFYLNTNFKCFVCVLSLRLDVQIKCQPILSITSYLEERKT